MEEIITMLESAITKTSSVNEVVEAPLSDETARAWDTLIFHFFPVQMPDEEQKLLLLAFCRDLPLSHHSRTITKLLYPEASIRQLYVQLISEEKALEKVQDALNTMQLATVDVKLYMECAAKFHDDGKWYRAEVTEITTKGVMVTFVDYGNTQICQVPDLRALPPTLLSSPFAYRCCLAGIWPSWAWCDDDSSKFCSIDESTVKENRGFANGGWRKPHTIIP